MKLRDFIPPVLNSAFRAGVGAVTKSAFAAAFIRGADLDGILTGAGGKLLQPYAQSAWVNRAISLKVDEITRVPLKFYDGKNEFADAAFADWWQKPFLAAGVLAADVLGKAQFMPLHEVRRQLATWLDLEGEFFIILGDDWLNPFAFRNWKALSRPLIARPDRMRHVVSAGQILGWSFTDGGARQHALLPEQVIHSREFNPYDDFRGLSQVKIVFNAAEAEYLAGVYVRNLMRNNGDQGAYVIAKGGMPGDDQKEQIVAALREKRAKALRGDFSAVFLTGDIAVEDPKAQATDTNFNAGRPINREEIFVGLKVPPSMATVKSSYSIGADSDRFTLITGSSMPRSAQVDAALSMLATFMIGRAIEAESDWDDHPVMQQVRRERIDTALKLWGTGWSWQQINGYLDLGAKGFPGWEKRYLPFSVAEIASDGTPATVPDADPEFDEDRADDADEDDAVKSLRLLLLARCRTRTRVCERQSTEAANFAEFACSHASCAAVAQRAERPARELAHWRALMAKRRTTVNAYQSAIRRVLMTARIETLRRLESSGLGKSAVEKSAALAVLFDLAAFATGFRRATENQSRAALDAAGKQLFEELNRDDVFKMPPVRAIEFLRERQNKLRDVPQEFYDRLKEKLEEGLAKGETHAELATRVKTVFNAIADGAARTIALTETSAAYGVARHEAMGQAGIQAKSWLTSGNANVRAAHEQAGLDYPSDRGIPIDEPFIVDGEELMYPGDDAGSPGNVINCHCVSIAVAPASKE